MSHLFPSRNKKTPTKLRNEDELIQLKMNDDYNRERSFRNFFSIIVKILVSLLLIALIIEYIIDLTFKAFIIETIKQNFAGIIFFVLSIAGVSHLNNKKDKQNL